MWLYRMGKNKDRMKCVGFALDKDIYQLRLIALLGLLGEVGGYWLLIKANFFKDWKW